MKEAYRIGIISDTHGKLRGEVLKILTGCDAILHTGDIDTEKVFKKLQSLAPLYAVRGNNDTGRWAEPIPEQLHITIRGIRFFMIHNRQYLPPDLPETDVILYGHSHRYECQEQGSILCLNPGSCGKRRFNLPLTMAVMEITDESYTIKKIDITGD